MIPADKKSEKLRSYLELESKLGLLARKMGKDQYRYDKMDDKFNKLWIGLSKDELAWLNARR